MTQASLHTREHFQEVSAMFAKIFVRNEGPTDRLIRLTIAVVLIPVGLFALDGVDASVAGIIVAAIGFLGLVTGATGRCPNYVPYRFSTIGGPHRISKTSPRPSTPEPDRALVSAGAVRRD